MLVGAGASISIDIPAMGEMFDSYRSQSGTKLSKEEKKVCEQFIDNLEIKKDLEEFLLASNTIIDASRGTLKKFFESIVAPRGGKNQLDQFETKLKESRNEVKKTRDGILKFLAEQCFRFNRAAAFSDLEQLVRAVSVTGHPVFTTNYDFAFEYVAEELGIPLHDNFSQTARRFIWNPEINFPSGEGLTLIKLHGSVTWYKDKNNEIEKLDTDTQFNKLGSRVERLLIFPTRFKDIYDQNFFALYSQFLSSISKARCLVVIGHSLRDEYLRAAIIEQIRLRKLQVVVIDPTWPKALSNGNPPSKQFTENTPIHIPVKFSEFSDELAECLKSTEAKQIGRELTSVWNTMKKRKTRLKLKGRIGTKLVPLQRYELSVTIDGYVPKNLRPVTLRAWISRTPSPTEGLKRPQTSGFIEQSTKPLDLNVSGVLNLETKLNLEIPKIDEWLAKGGNVELNIALLPRSTSMVAKAKNSAIATGTRSYKYSV